MGLVCPGGPARLGLGNGGREQRGKRPAADQSGSARHPVCEAVIPAPMGWEGARETRGPALSGGDRLVGAEGLWEARREGAEPKV